MNKLILTFFAILLAPYSSFGNQADSKIPSQQEAITFSLNKAAKMAKSLLLDPGHHDGKILTVDLNSSTPGHYQTIQKAIHDAKPRDVVLVKPGIYKESIVMKAGIKLISDSANGGNQQQHVTITLSNGTTTTSILKLPKRTLETIIDGSYRSPNPLGEDRKKGMIDFTGTEDRTTIVDGFTARNLPEQDHHIPGHAHAINIRGANPTIMNCLIHSNGSTGVGTHVVYHDQNLEIPQRDFRKANIKFKAQAIIYNNIIYGNDGLGIGVNHFATPYILGNEVLNNAEKDNQNGTSTPGIGSTHGAAPIIVGNIVYQNIGGGLLTRQGDSQGKYPVDEVSHPTFRKNTVFKNGTNYPQIAAFNTGSANLPVNIISNYVFDPEMLAIVLGNNAVGIIEKNHVINVSFPGIMINNSIALKINYNIIKRFSFRPGIMLLKGAKAIEMVGNEIINGKALIK